MTEAEWLASTKPEPMLEFLDGKTSDRKMRLFAVSCGRRVIEWMVDARSRQALSVSEQYADGSAGRKVLAAARRSAFPASRASEAAQPIANYYPAASHAAIVALHAAADTAKDKAIGLARITAGTVSGLVWNIRKGNSEYEEMEAQAHILRDIICNPFRPVGLDPSWLSSTVVGLTDAIYSERAFDRLPILADALEEAGCDHPDVLAHCRGDGPHVRGCWVVDLLTGRE